MTFRVSGGIGIATAIMSAQMVISVPRLPCSTLNSRHGTHQLATVSNSFQSTSLGLPRAGYSRGSISQLRERDSAVVGAVKSTFTPYTEEIDSVGEDFTVLSRPVVRFALSESRDHSMRECGIILVASSCCLILS